MRLAIIDLGTNTFNLLIGETYETHTFSKLFNTKVSVKLGEGSINDGYIAEISFQRGINALKQYQQELLKYEVEQVFAFATSAIRSATNGKDFIKQAKAQSGITITVIDGNEEADLIYFGTRLAVKMNTSMSLIMDIGGGSNELILANEHTVFWKQSFLLGAARLLAKFKPSNPITQTEIETINAYLKKEFAPLIEAIKLYPPTELIGSSGAFDSVIDMIAGEYGTTETNDVQTEYSINLKQYQIISEKIIQSTLNERLKIKGLIQMRVDMMVISCLLIDFIINECRIQSFRASAYSLKEGAIARILSSGKNI